MVGGGLVLAQFPFLGIKFSCTSAKFTQKAGLCKGRVCFEVVSLLRSGLPLSFLPQTYGDDESTRQALFPCLSNLNPWWVFLSFGFRLFLAVLIRADPTGVAHHTYSAPKDLEGCLDWEAGACAKGEGGQRTPDLTTHRGRLERVPVLRHYRVEAGSCQVLPELERGEEKKRKGESLKVRLFCLPEIRACGSHRDLTSDTVLGKVDSSVSEEDVDMDNIT